MIEQIFSKLFNLNTFDNINHFLLNDFEIKFVKKDLKNYKFPTNKTNVLNKCLQITLKYKKFNSRDSKFIHNFFKSIYTAFNNNQNLQQLSIFSKHKFSQIKFELLINILSLCKETINILVDMKIQ